MLLSAKWSGENEKKKVGLVCSSLHFCLVGFVQETEFTLFLCWIWMGKSRDRRVSAVSVRMCICLITAPVNHGNPRGTGEQTSRGREGLRGMLSCHRPTLEPCDSSPSPLFVKVRNLQPWALLLRVSLGLGHHLCSLTLQTLLCRLVCSLNQNRRLSVFINPSAWYWLRQWMLSFLKFLFYLVILEPEDHQDFKTLWNILVSILSWKSVQLLILLKLFSMT